MRRSGKSRGQLLILGRLDARARRHANSHARRLDRARVAELLGESPSRFRRVAVLLAVLTGSAAGLLAVLVVEACR